MRERNRTIPDSSDSTVQWYKIRHIRSNKRDASRIKFLRDEIGLKNFAKNVFTKDTYIAMSNYLTCHIDSFKTARGSINHRRSRPPSMQRERSWELVKRRGSFSSIELRSIDQAESLERSHALRSTEGKTVPKVEDASKGNRNKGWEEEGGIQMKKERKREEGKEQRRIGNWKRNSRRSTRERASDAVLRSASPPATATPSRHTLARWYRRYAPDPLPPASRHSPDFDGPIASEFCLAYNLKPDLTFFDGCCHGGGSSNKCATISTNYVRSLVGRLETVSLWQSYKVTKHRSVGKEMIGSPMVPSRDD